MINAWKEIERLIQVNAKHRRGFRLQDVSTTFILSQAQDELNELCENNTNSEELADLFGVLIHYAIKQAWSMNYLEYVILLKLKMRFQEEKIS